MSDTGFSFPHPSGVGTYVNTEPAFSQDATSYSAVGPVFSAVAKKESTDSDVIAITSGAKQITFSPFRIRWKLESGVQLISGVVSKQGTVESNTTKILGYTSEKTKAVIWEDVFGAGIDMGVAVDAMLLKKVVRVETLAALGEVPATATHLEVIFKVNTNLSLGSWDKASELIWTDPQSIGSGDVEAVGRPQAWDSTGSRVAVDGVFSEAGGQLYVGKRIPLAVVTGASFPLYTDADFTFQTGQQVLSVSNIDNIRLGVVDAINKRVICKWSNSNEIEGLIAQYNGGTSWTLGTVDVSGMNIQNNGPVPIARKDSGLDKWVVVSRDQVAGGDPNLIVGSYTSATTLSWGALDERDTTDVQKMGAVYLADDKIFVFEKVDVGTNHFQGSVITFSGDSPTWQTPTDLVNTGSIESTYQVRIDSDKVLCIWEDETNNEIRGAVATISGTSVSWGSINTLVSLTNTEGRGIGAASKYDWLEDADDSDKAVMIYVDTTDGNDYPDIVGLSVSADTNTITVGSAQNIAAVRGTGLSCSLAGPIQVFACYNDNDNDRAKTALCDVDWSGTPAITVNTPEIVSTTASVDNGHVECIRVNDGEVFFVYRDLTDLDGIIRAATYTQKSDSIGNIYLGLMKVGG